MNGWILDKTGDVGYICEKDDDLYTVRFSSWDQPCYVQDNDIERPATAKEITTVLRREKNIRYPKGIVCPYSGEVITRFQYHMDDDKFVGLDNKYDADVLIYMQGSWIYNKLTIQVWN